jgi:hypothetical protein
MEDVDVHILCSFGIFYGHLVYFIPSGTFYNHRVYVEVNWCVFPRFGLLYIGNKKMWQLCLHTQTPT